MKVDVYFNLHKKVWSIRDKKSGLVIAHRRELTLKDATMRVQPAGRDRVRREGTKNVHAFISGEWVDTPYGTDQPLVDHSSLEEEITYNPYMYDSFVAKRTEKPVFGAEWVVFRGKNVLAKGITYGRENTN